MQLYLYGVPKSLINEKEGSNKPLDKLIATLLSFPQGRKYNKFPGLPNDQEPSFLALGP